MIAKPMASPALIRPPGLILPRSVRASLVFADARDDMSAFILEDFLKAGFREVEWRYGFEPWQNTKLWREMGSVCPVCFALDGQRFKIEWLLANMGHNAPKYTLSHVNCQCELFRIERGEERLDYSEAVDVAPSDIDQSLTQGPIDLDQVAPAERPGLGLPEEKNEWTGVQWIWDAERGEFIPLQRYKEEGGSLIWDEQAGEYRVKPEAKQ